MERAETGEDHSAAGQTAEPAEKQVPEGGSGTGSKDPKDRIDLSFRPNEAGKIMVLMYHNIGGEEGEWVRTPANFIRDMETLYQKGYRPISLKDYVSGNITTEQGYTPVVITFDDGNLNNFEYLENGEIREDCAVGLLLGFHNEHKDFPLEATFFLNGEQPFRQSSLIDKKLNFIVENGMDIGNHTKDHNSFRNMDAEEIQRQIGSEAQYLEHIFGSSDYEVNTLALPFGERPKDEALMKYLTEGTYEDIPYTNIAVLNVGWNPAYSPYDKKFDHSSIPRIRASEMKVDNVGIYNYIDYFDKHPEERFISDGIAEVITIPEEKKELLIHDSGREVYLYSPGEE
jgi:peptidoglycan/xylan/chitin deacetylase (PgdA/CDA1 family)